MKGQDLVFFISLEFCATILIKTAGLRFVLKAVNSSIRK